jgi:hypothetical protein
MADGPNLAPEIIEAAFGTCGDSIMTDSWEKDW